MADEWHEFESEDGQRYRIYPGGTWEGQLPEGKSWVGGLRRRRVHAAVWEECLRLAAREQELEAVITEREERDRRLNEESPYEGSPLQKIDQLRAQVGVLKAEKAELLALTGKIAEEFGVLAMAQVEEFGRMSPAAKRIQSLLSSPDAQKAAGELEELRGGFQEALQVIKRQAEEIADCRALLSPAAGEESLTGAIRNLQQAHLTEQENAEKLEADNEALRASIQALEGMREDLSTLPCCRFWLVDLHLDDRAEIAPGDHHARWCPKAILSRWPAPSSAPGAPDDRSALQARVAELEAENTKMRGWPDASRMDYLEAENERLEARLAKLDELLRSEEPPEGLRDAFFVERQERPSEVAWRWFQEALAAPPAEPQEGRHRHGVYIASKARHAERWKLLRSSGVPVISSWIDEAGAGQTKDWADLWRRCLEEIRRAETFILYREHGDILGGALVEMGVALAAGTPVIWAGPTEGDGAPKNGAVRVVESINEALVLLFPPELQEAGKGPPELAPDQKDLMEALRASLSAQPKKKRGKRAGEGQADPTAERFAARCQVHPWVPEPCPDCEAKIAGGL